MIRRAMVLAAGRGERMRPLTDSLPKPLIEVAGKALIDHVLDRLAEAGVDRTVVNLCYMAETMAGHLAGRDRPAVSLSWEDDLLDTGGGVAKALPMLGAAPFYVVSGDGLWWGGTLSALARLAAAWDDTAMDALLLLQPRGDAIGFDGAGDFFLEPDGRLRRRGAAPSAPYAYTSIQIAHPRLYGDCPSGAFSNNRLWDRALAAGRLHGVVHDGAWCHVGTPAGRDAAERRLADG